MFALRFLVHALSDILEDDFQIFDTKLTDMKGNLCNVRAGGGGIPLIRVPLAEDLLGGGVVYDN